MLGRWVDFARSATVLPTEGKEGLLRSSVTDIIALQAVWFALAHLDELASDQRLLGLDRSQILIDQHAEALVSRFASDMPSAIAKLIDDAHEQMRRARGHG